MSEDVYMIEAADLSAGDVLGPDNGFELGGNWTGWEVIEVQDRTDNPADGVVVFLQPNASSSLRPGGAPWLDAPVPWLVANRSQVIECTESPAAEAEEAQLAALDERAALGGDPDEEYDRSRE